MGSLLSIAWNNKMLKFYEHITLLLPVKISKVLFVLYMSYFIVDWWDGENCLVWTCVLFVLSVKETQQLILMLGGEHTVISQAADLIDDPIVMYKTTHHIKGRY